MRVVMETPLSERRAIVVPRVLVSPISHVPPSVSPQSAPVSGFVSPQGRAETSAAASPGRLFNSSRFVSQHRARIISRLKPVLINSAQLLINSLLYPWRYCGCFASLINACELSFPRGVVHDLKAFQTLANSFVRLDY